MSTKQTVPVVQLFDYEYDPAGNPLVHAPVEVELQYSLALLNSPQLIVENVKQTTVTDANGWWAVSVVANANANLTPANTVYSVATPYRRFQVSIPTGAGPFQASANLANAVSTLSPAATGLTGPITVTGNETVTGNLTVQGTTTLQTGATVTGGETVSGGLTVSTGGVTVSAGGITDTGNVSIAGSLTTSGVSGTITSSQGLTVQAGGAAITGATTITGAETVSGVLTANGGITDTGNVSIAGSLTTTGASGTGTFSQGLTVQAGGAAITGASTVTGALTVSGRILGAGTSPVANTNINANVNTIAVSGFDLAHKITFNTVTGTIAAGSRLFTVTLGTGFPTQLIAVGVGANAGAASWSLDLIPTAVNTYDVYNVTALGVSTGWQMDVITAGW